MRHGPAIRFLLAVAGLALAACASAPTAPTPAPAPAQAVARDAEPLARLLEGAWSSAEQAARDADYQDIKTVNVRIWAGDPEHSGAWFHTESARATTPDQPYRQNVFNLVAQDDGSINAYQYRVRDPGRFAGSAMRGTPPAGLKVEDLIALPGCTLVWRPAEAGVWRGAMRPKACRNNFRGATWMDGSSRVDGATLLTWDRGMGGDDRQMWGPTKGGYEFRRIAPPPPAPRTPQAPSAP